MDRFSNRSLDRLEYVSPILIKILKEGIKHSPYDFGIPRDGGFRTFQRQAELYARGRTTNELIEKGKDALENMIEVARESEHPRAYEVLAGLIKDTAQTSEKLMDLRTFIWATQCLLSLSSLCNLPLRSRPNSWLSTH